MKLIITADMCWGPGWRRNHLQGGRKGQSMKSFSSKIQHEGYFHLALLFLAHWNSVKRAKRLIKTVQKHLVVCPQMHSCVLVALNCREQTQREEKNNYFMVRSQYFSPKLVQVGFVLVGFPAVSVSPATKMDRDVNLCTS